MNSIYLAGPITGCMHAEAVGWRDQFAKLMKTNPLTGNFTGGNVECLSPMRGKEHLAKLDSAITGAYPESLTSNQRSIMHRDHRDVLTCGLVVANLLKDAVPAGQRASLGTAMELAWCYDHHKIVIAIMDPPGEGGQYEHPMLLECISYRVTTIEQAAEIAKLVFNIRG